MEIFCNMINASAVTFDEYNVYIPSFIAFTICLHSETADSVSITEKNTFNCNKASYDKSFGLFVISNPP